MNAHLIEITYSGATNTRGSRVVLTSHRFENDRISDGYACEIGSTFSQAEVMLRRLGYTVVCGGESKKGYFACVQEFTPLREAFAAFKAQKGGAK